MVISIDTVLAFMTGRGENACMKVVIEMLHVEAFETRTKNYVLSTDQELFKGNI